jgi:hypothetical protein
LKQVSRCSTAPALFTVVGTVTVHLPHLRTTPPVPLATTACVYAAYIPTRRAATALPLYPLRRLLLLLVKGTTSILIFPINFCPRGAVATRVGVVHLLSTPVFCLRLHEAERRKAAAENCLGGLKRRFFERAVKLRELASVTTCAGPDDARLLVSAVRPAGVGGAGVEGHGERDFCSSTATVAVCHLKRPFAHKAFVLMMNCAGDATARTHTHTVHG